MKAPSNIKDADDKIGTVVSHLTKKDIQSIMNNHYEEKGIIAIVMDSSNRAAWVRFRGWIEDKLDYADIWVFIIGGDATERDLIFS